MPAGRKELDHSRFSHPHALFLQPEGLAAGEEPGPPRDTGAHEHWEPRPKPGPGWEIPAEGLSQGDWMQCHMTALAAGLGAIPVHGQPLTSESPYPVQTD